MQLTRKIEQGARIITAIGTETGLVLQMPRGNLETISPRPLVLAKITHALAKLEYDVAFMLCRRHRVDLNLLVDYDFETFMSSIAKFVVLVANPSYLNLFVTALVDGNVAISMYNISPQGATMPSDKVNTICCALRRELEASHDTTKYLETILTTECKQSPPLLESAMARIYALHTHGQSALADRSLAYLIFLADGDVLYDLALGTYDFQLVVMVAKQTDRDPREYMPFLAHLQTLDEDYMRYSVDVHLRHMDDALRNLAKSKGRFDELVKFVEDNDMYVNALELFEKTSDEYRQLASVFAQHLETESLFNQAGVMHEQSGTADSVEEAVRCYMLAGEWTAGYMIMLRNQFSVASIAENAHSCADNLFRDRRFKDAAIIFEQVVGAYDRAAECLVHAGDFPAAYMLKAKHALAIDVDAGLLATCTEYTADLESQLVSFEAQLKRLAQVGEKKLQFNIVMRNARMHGGALDGIDMLEDTASMATTATGQSASSLASQSSGLTGKSGRTGKQRRKMARRRASGKDPAFEDEYLVTKMKVQMEKIDAEQKMVTELLKWLVRIDRRRAQALQTAYGNVVAMHVYHMNVVFAPLVQVELQNDDEDQNADANSPKVATVINRPILTTGKWWLDILRPPPPADFTLKV